MHLFDARPPQSMQRRFRTRLLMSASLEGAKSNLFNMKKGTEVTHVAYIVACRGHRIEPGDRFCTRRHAYGTEVPRGDGGIAQGSRSQGGRAEIPRGNGYGAEVPRG